MSTNIENKVAEIRSAQYGRDVREAIASGIEMIYADAINTDNANLEIINAKGDYATLDARLDAECIQPYDSGWVTLPLATGVTAVDRCGSSVPQYRKIGTHVYVRGAIKFTTPATDTPTLLATLPPNCRPYNNIILHTNTVGKRLAKTIIEPSGIISNNYVIDVSTGNWVASAEIDIYCLQCDFFVIGTGLQEQDYANQITNIANANNCLYRKRFGALGDSLTRGHTLDASKTWVADIGLRNSMTYYNYGQNGNCLAGTGGMAERYTSMADNLNYVLVMGGANDLTQGIAIGTNTDTTTATFKGALNVLIDGLRTKYPSAHIGFMTNLHRGFAGEQAYVDAMVEICRIKGMPCRNNYTDMGINFEDANQSAIMDLGVASGSTANKHLSEYGNDFVSYGIEQYMRGL